MNEFELHKKLIKKVSEYRSLTKRYLINQVIEYKITLGNMRDDIDYILNQMKHGVMVMDHIKFRDMVLKMRNSERQYIINGMKRRDFVAMVCNRKEVDKFLKLMDVKKEAIS